VGRCKHLRPRDLALMGVLPDTFRAFMQNIGHPYAKVKPLVRALIALLRKHLRTVYYSYSSLAKRER